MRRATCIAAQCAGAYFGTMDDWRIAHSVEFFESADYAGKRPWLHLEEHGECVEVTADHPCSDQSSAVVLTRNQLTTIQNP